jgi:TetR/AcrR family transcriptional regulator, fatty acid metabolism regulator protein
MKHKGLTDPPGRRKIIQALTELMRTRDFNSVTTVEIAAAAGVTEGLIYKYFDSKKDLLYQVLDEHFSEFHQYILDQIASRDSVIEKLEMIIRASIQSYAANRVFARILLLEVRNSQEYFSSEAYATVKLYTRNILSIIQEGIAKGELKPDIDPLMFRKVILGAIEHACLGEILFSGNLDAQTAALSISTILFNGAKHADRSCPTTD